MNVHTDTYAPTPPAVIATVPPRRWRATFGALGLAAMLGIGVGVGAAALLDDGSGSVARPPTAAATVTNTSTADADTLWNYLAQLPAAQRDKMLVALTDPTDALRAIVTGMVSSAG